MNDTRKQIEERYLLVGDYQVLKLGNFMELKNPEAKVPVSKSEMLAVSGVGENKYVKYGERFLGLIKKIIEDYPDLIEATEKAGKGKIWMVKESSWLAEKREEHAGAYKPWTDEEDRRLTSEFKSGQFSSRDLSEIHGRTAGAIRARISICNRSERNGESYR